MPSSSSGSCSTQPGARIDLAMRQRSSGGRASAPTSSARGAGGALVDGEHVHARVFMHGELGRACRCRGQRRDRQALCAVGQAPTAVATRAGVADTQAEPPRHWAGDAKLQSRRDALRRCARCAAAGHSCSAVLRSAIAGLRGAAGRRQGMRDGRPPRRPRASTIRRSRRPQQVAGREDGGVRGAAELVDLRAAGRRVERQMAGPQQGRFGRKAPVRMMPSAARRRVRRPAVYITARDHRLALDGDEFVPRTAGCREEPAAAPPASAP